MLLGGLEVLAVLAVLAREEEDGLGGYPVLHREMIEN
jgi:hypothetical protein